MTQKEKKAAAEPASDDASARIASTSDEMKSCFVIMPIADMDGYDPGHWDRVFNHLIKPACLKAGFEAHRADMVAASNYIIIDILRKIVESDLVICDLSGRNPNVLYELGVRQAFNLPTVLIKDEITPRIFDIQGLRCFDYKHSLRVDQVEKEHESISEVIADTMSQTHEVNSMIQLLGVSPAPMPMKMELSNETSVILESLKDISSRLSSIESGPLNSKSDPAVVSEGRIKRVAVRRPAYVVNGEQVFPGEALFIEGKDIGKLVSVNDEAVIVQDDSGALTHYRKHSSVAKKITTLPF